VLPVIRALLPSPAVEPASTFLFWMRPQHDDDHPFIVLTETKFSFRCIPVGIGTLLTGLGLKKKTHVMMLSP
jgi:hypothetical protein